MNEDSLSFMDRHHFLLRRLHSLTGVIPIGFFLFPHLTTNSSIVWGNYLGKSHLGGSGHAGVETFQHEVNFIHGLPFLILIEIFVLWLPIAFHAGLGVYFATSGKPNVKAYGYGGNWRYTLQRLSGYLGVLFIFMHIASLRWGWGFWGLFPDWSADFAASTTAEHFQAGSALRTFIISAFYLVAVTGLVYHFANGLWTAAITWGLTISEGAQKRWGYVCGLIGVGLSIAGIMAVMGFVNLDIEKARDVETRMLAGEMSHDVMPSQSLPDGEPENESGESDDHTGHDDG